MRTLRLGLVLGLLAVASACGNGDDTTTSSNPSDTATPSSTTTIESPTTTEPPVTTGPTSTAPVSTPAPTTPSPDPTLVDVRIYLLRDERLAVTHRQVEGPAVLRNTLTELLEGPTDSDRSAGLHSEIPDLSLIHISEPTRLGMLSRMPSSA